MSLPCALSKMVVGTGKTPGRTRPRCPQGSRAASVSENGKYLSPNRQEFWKKTWWRISGLGYYLFNRFNILFLVLILITKLNSWWALVKSLGCCFELTDMGGGALWNSIYWGNHAFILIKWIDLAHTHWVLFSLIHTHIYSQLVFLSIRVFFKTQMN